MFDREGEAVKELMKLFGKNGDKDQDDKGIVSNEALDAAQKAIDNLVEADRTLAEVKIEDAKNAPALDPARQDKVDREIAWAMEALTKGDEDRDAGNSDKAIDYYRKAWEHVVKAMEAQAQTVKRK